MTTTHAFVYTENVTLFRITLEIQVSFEEDKPTWHIFLHREDFTGLNGTKYYKIRGGPLYDVIVQAIHAYDITYSTKFYSQCILKGYWTSTGIPLKTTNKRMWYFMLINEQATDELIKSIPTADRAKIKPYL